MINVITKAELQETEQKKDKRHTTRTDLQKVTQQKQLVKIKMCERGRFK